jgi:lysophospholipase L1-like esterase
MTGVRRWVVVAVAVVVVLAGTAAVLLLRGSGSTAADHAAGQPSAASRSASPSSAPPSPAPSSSAPEVVFLGDSWTVGVGATGERGYAPLAAERLGWEYELLGISGSGYLARGAASPYADRVDEAVGLEPDLLVVQGSLNDSGADPEQLDRATAETLDRLRATAGDGTAILVVGAPDTPGTDPAVIARINSGIAAAAAAAGLPFVDPARENWTDPADPGIWADPVHPDDDGHRLVAEALVPHMQAALDG